MPEAVSFWALWYYPEPLAGRCRPLETSNVEYIRELTKLPILGKMPLSSELNVQELSQPNLALTAEKSLAMDEIIACMMGEKK